MLLYKNMQFIRFFKPTAVTWMIVVSIAFICVINLVALNVYAFGSEILAGVVVFLPMALLKAMHLPVFTSTGWFPTPTAFGWSLIVFCDAIVFYFIAIILTRLYEKVNKMMKNNS